MKKKPITHYCPECKWPLLEIMTEYHTAYACFKCSEEDYWKGRTVHREPSHAMSEVNIEAELDAFIHALELFDSDEGLFF